MKVTFRKALLTVLQGDKKNVCRDALSILLRDSSLPSPEWSVKGGRERWIGD